MRTADTRGATVEPATPGHARAARTAHARFGGGRHPARLTLGDRFAHAPAGGRGEAPPYKGESFARTDLRPAL